MENLTAVLSVPPFSEMGTPLRSPALWRAAPDAPGN